MGVLKKTLTLFFLFLSAGLHAETISPLSYGLKEARTGEERFWVLYETHSTANKYGWKVSYKGINDVYLEVPSNAKSIPLSNCTDFCGTSFIVRNTQKDDFYLFELTQDLHSIDIPKSFFVNYDFRSLKGLNQNNVLLVVEDNNLWIRNRQGHNYSVKRKDVLFIKNGKAKNQTILPYNNEFSSPKCWFAYVTNRVKQFKNVTLQRTSDSSVKTYLVKVSNMNNVLLSGIKIITPDPIIMNADHAITIENCTNVSIKDVDIVRTYSFENKYGYGIVLNNVWNVFIDKVVSESAWGVFGNNNLSNVHMSNCDVNRFDAHCYARDFYFSRCIFSLVGVPESSFVGEMVFECCIFKQATLCNSRSDYNAYTPFSITLKDCTVYFDRNHHTLVYLSNVPQEPNDRIELKMKYTPSLNIINSTIVLNDDNKYWTFFELGPQSRENPFGGIGAIRVDGLKVIGDSNRILVFNQDIETHGEVVVELKDIEFYNKQKELVAIDQKLEKNRIEVNIINKNSSKLTKEY